MRGINIRFEGQKSDWCRHKSASQQGANSGHLVDMQTNEALRTNHPVRGISVCDGETYQRHFC